MKKLNLLLALASIVLIAGCSGCAALTRQPVPATRISGTLGGAPFTLESPKQGEWTGVDLTMSTGVTNFHLHIDSVKAVNDPQVIDKASAGRVAEINAWKDLMATGIEKGGEGIAKGAAKGLKGGL